MASHQLTDVEARACTILSEFFLDTHYSPPELDRFALRLHELNLPIAKLDHILCNDLFPILYPNLMGFAVLMGALDKDWLLDEVRCQRLTGLFLIETMGCSIAWNMVGVTVTNVWNPVKEKMRKDFSHT